jgi:predicted PurR-regulated permease PerM
VRIARVEIERDPGRVVAAIGSTVLVVAALWILWPIAAPILWAGLVSYLLWPLNERVQRRLAGRRSAAAMLMSIGALFGLLVPLVLIGFAFARQSIDLAHRASEIRLADELRRLPWLSNVGHWVQTRSPIGPEVIRERALSALGSSLELLASRLGAVFAGALGIVVGLALTLFVMFFLLRDGKNVMHTFLASLPFDEDRKHSFVIHVGAITRGLVVGSLVTAILQGTLVGVAFAILGIPSAVVFGVISALVSVLPVGTALVWVPTAVVLLIQGRIGAAIFLTLWGILVVGLIDNILRPRIVSGRAKVPALPVFLGIVGGISSFGVLGLIVGPVILVLAVELVAEIAKTRQQAREAAAPV